SDPTTVVAPPVPDLSIVKSHTGNFGVGTFSVYSLLVTNVGNAATTGAITVSDPLPPGLTFESATGPDFTCVAVLQVVSCARQTPLAAGANATITLTVAVGAAALPSVTNTATVSTPGDTNAGNNSSSNLAQVFPPDLLITIDGNPSNVKV